MIFGNTKNIKGVKMTIFRTKHSKNYTVVNNTICTDSRISFKAKGIWLYAFSRPDDWTFYLKDIVNQSKDGEDSVRSGLKELEKYGYLVKVQNRAEDGKFGHIDWEFFEVPTEVKECLPKGENPNAVNPHAVNPSLLSTEVLPSIEKKQQQPAAVFSDVKRTETCKHLLLIQIPDTEKRWISERYDDNTIKHAVAFATHPSTKIKTSLEQAIKWACVNKPELPKEPPAAKPDPTSPEQIFANRAIVKEFLKNIWSNLDLRRMIDDRVDYAQVGYDKIYYRDTKFRELFNHSIQKIKD
jgi:hypothetical protein